MKTLKILIGISLMMISLSCKKFVEIDAPANQLIRTTVFENDETAIAALTSIYSQLNNEDVFPYAVALRTGFYSDELKNYSTTTSFIQFYTNSLNSINGVSPNFWQRAYSEIYQANAVIEGCTQSTAMSPQVKKQIIAEALFLRAFVYFYVVNMYGDAPLVTSTDYRVNALLNRAPVSVIYDQLITDLTQAANDLNPQYVAVNSISTSTERIRPNQAAASALLARIALYSGKYTLAETESSKVIANAAYSLPSPANAFLKTSPEAIWQLMTPLPSATLTNTQEGNGFILIAAAENSGSRNATISTQLQNAFEANDQRKTNWVANFTVGTTLYPYPFKYKQRAVTSSVTECTIPLRLAEQYLIRAEARAQLNNVSGSQSDLNRVRTRAGLGNTPAADQASLLTAILKERQVELFCEYGHRWFDLKRTGNADAVMTTVAPTKGGTWAPYKKLWPLPTQDLNNDPNLQQNPGYN